MKKSDFLILLSIIINGQKFFDHLPVYAHEEIAQLHHENKGNDPSSLLAQGRDYVFEVWVDPLYY